MATVDTSMIRKEFRAIAATSNAVRKLLREALEQLESDPTKYPALDCVHSRIATLFPSVTLRKVRIVSGRHDFRIIVAHWDRGEHEDHVDGLYAFARKAGYPIDWEEVENMLGEPE